MPANCMGIPVVTTIPVRDTIPNTFGSRCVEMDHGSVERNRKARTVDSKTTTDGL